VSLHIALGVFAVLVVAGAAQSLSGFGFSLLAVPMLATLLGPRHGVVLASCLGLIVSTLLLIRNHDHTRWPTAGRLLGGAVLGMPIGLLLLFGLNPSVLRATIAVAVLVAAFLIAREVQLPVHGPRAEVTAGLVSGALNTSTSMNGPPLVITLQGQGLAPDVFRATLSAVFVASGVIANTSFAVTGQIDHTVRVGILVGAPAALVGFVGGEMVFRRTDPRRFRTIVLTMLVASALVALASLAA
jgi:uncharacterized protein